jgi:hypothetical protein
VAIVVVVGGGEVVVVVVVVVAEGVEDWLKGGIGGWVGVASAGKLGGRIAVIWMVFVRNLDAVRDEVR